MLAASLALGALIGVVIGALGGGGGVLTVPLLVFVLGLSAQDATTSSVLIVGVTSLVGVLLRMRGGLVRWRTGLAFGLAGVPAAFLGTLLNGRVEQPVLLLSFAGLTVLAGTAMLIRPHEPDVPVDVDEGSGPGSSDALGAATRVRPVTRRAAVPAKIVVYGALVGFLTGFLGVGGGFLVVPALVVALRIPMTQAIGTSLLIISINAVASLASRAGVAEFDWGMVLPFSAAAIAGVFAGKLVSDRVAGATLARAFGVLLLAVGVFVGVQGLHGIVVG
ncbi:sulfite exporter TauE/SafE family protein [Pseudonocardia bannensis]|nr:sulfite exporter TauE/SafE family protein [Pseudonocardia bannensis]